METTARHGLPYLVPGQAQKEWFHNEALQIADMLLCPVVETGAAAAPPSSPVEGSCYLVAAAPTGAWTGRDHALAAWTSNGWRFAQLPEGSKCTVKASGYVLTRTASGWDGGGVKAANLLVGGVQVVGAQQAAVANASGGSVIDVQARAAINALLAALRTHGLIAP